MSQLYSPISPATYDNAADQRQPRQRISPGRNPGQVVNPSAVTITPGGVGAPIQTAATSAQRLGGTYVNSPQFQSITPVQRGQAAGRVSGTDFLSPSFSPYSNAPANPSPNAASPIGPGLYDKPMTPTPQNWSASGIGPNGQAVNWTGSQGMTHTGAAITPAQGPEEMAAGRMAMQAKHAILSPTGPTSAFDYQNQQSGQARADTIVGAVATGAENQASNAKQLQGQLQQANALIQRYHAGELKAGNDESKNYLAQQNIGIKAATTQQSHEDRVSEGDKNRASKERMAAGNKKPAASEGQTYLDAAQKAARILGQGARPEQIDQLLAELGIKKPGASPTTQPTAGAAPAGQPTLNVEQAREYLAKFGGDRAKAEAAAKADGHTF